MQGTFRYPDGSEYSGKIKQNKIVLKIKQESFNNYNIKNNEGEWNEDGQRHGLGQLIFNDQAKYRGRFENGLFAGLGSILYPDGSK